MAVADVSDWMNEFTDENIIWYVKRLSGNDTLANGSHQAGPYVPKAVIFSIFPQLRRITDKNAEVRFRLYIDSHADARDIRAIWYNNKFRGGTRDEARLTNFGGGSSALLDPESTGAIAVFAFVTGLPNSTVECHVWVTRTEVEEDVIESRTGPIEPGTWITMSAGHLPRLPFEEEPRRASCWLSPDEIPHQWLTVFPPGTKIIEKAISMRPALGLSPDQRILTRRKCEFEVFRSVEEAVELPRIKNGFADVESFLQMAQTILQRRKARSGRSLELHTRHILLEEGFSEGTEFAHGPESERGKRPDFLFPSETAYKSPAFPESRLRMLAVKTTCRDRWRQILNEADRIANKHLLTLQEGVSENQFREMRDAGVTLVVPEGLRDAYPAVVRPDLLSIESFIGDLRLLN